MTTRPSRPCACPGFFLPTRRTHGQPTDPWATPPMSASGGPPFAACIQSLVLLNLDLTGYARLSASPEVGLISPGMGLLALPVRLGSEQSLYHPLGLTIQPAIMADSASTPRHSLLSHCGPFHLVPSVPGFRFP
ncbi:hypothetical protein ASPBRDRAFT_240045 [Aspergillus brasiliensis CBS 101740]|uniref:Uncharacterized protein n=1 Tax=Aspergillus brasiliensis (strain CBS 101740 / IMI 381727 / IBT 21946) TaxID=767769 RepID=A0A1L9V121_ASPBC|nr:hypothetical protein ASPBRDRAFT_240045 [Aspergillus brasiliensis CBS 101740]